MHSSCSGMPWVLDTELLRNLINLVAAGDWTLGYRWLCQKGPEVEKGLQTLWKAILARIFHELASRCGVRCTGFLNDECVQLRRGVSRCLFVETAVRTSSDTHVRHTCVFMYR